MAALPANQSRKLVEPQKKQKKQKKKQNKKKQKRKNNQTKTNNPNNTKKYSIDAFLTAAWASGTAVGRYSFCLGLFAAFITAFYSWRLLFMTFHGKSRADHEVLHHAHESPPVMLWPLVVLAIGAVVAGFLGFN